MWAGNRAAVGQWAHQGNGDDDVIVLFRFGGRHAWTCFGIVVAAAVTYDVWGGNGVGMAQGVVLGQLGDCMYGSKHVGALGVGH